MHRGQVVELRISDCQFGAAGFYELKTNGDECLAELIVEDKPLDFISGFSDLTVNCQEYAEFKCIVNDSMATGRWYKESFYDANFKLYR